MFRMSLISWTGRTSTPLCACVLRALVEAIGESVCVGESVRAGVYGGECESDVCVCVHVKVQSRFVFELTKSVLSKEMS